MNENSAKYEIRHYLTSDEKDLYLEWHRKLRDTKARIAIDRRINRVELGNFGDQKCCRDGVWELRIDVRTGIPGLLRSRRKPGRLAALRRR